MSNVKKGDLAIKVGGPNLGALVRVIGEGPKPASWACIPMEAVVSVLGYRFKPGEPGWTYDAWLRPLRGDPPVEVEKIADTQPSEVEA